MESLSTFFDMGGYAAFVWPGYGLAALALIGLLVITLRGLKAREREFADVRRARHNPGATP
ncbi:MAG: heme exporter protein CcmD [Rhodospirillaceae bacterium]